LIHFLVVAQLGWLRIDWGGISLASTKTRQHLRQQSEGWDSMAHDTVSMPIMFPAIADVLRDALVPLSSPELTRRALESLGYTKDDVNWKRQVEDVRDKCLIHHQHGTAYVGKPLAVGYLTSWVQLSQGLLLNNERPVCLCAEFPLSEEAAFEALMRQPYMIQKTNAPKVRVYRARARGLLIEHHVSGWFKTHWPEYWRPPDNYGQWDRPCDHDFKLQVPGRTFKVDVAGKHLDGTYGLSHSKVATDIHILANLDGDQLLLEGFKPGQSFTEIVDAWFSSPIAPLLVYLNCCRIGIDWGLLRRASFI